MQNKRARDATSLAPVGVPKEHGHHVLRGLSSIVGQPKKRLLLEVAKEEEKSVSRTIR